MTLLEPLSPTDSIMRQPTNSYSRLTTLVAGIVLLSGCSFHSSPEDSQEVALQGFYSASFNEDGRYVVFGSINHGGGFWGIEEQSRIYSWNHKQGEYSQIVRADFTPDSRFAITATPQTMVLWDVTSGTPFNYWTAPSEILDIELFPNGNFALLGLADHSATIFDVQQGGSVGTFYHDDEVNSVDISNDGTKILTGSDDFSAKLWDVNSGSELISWTHLDEVQLVELSPDGTLAFTMAKYDRAAIWNTSNGSLVVQLPINEGSIRRGGMITAAAFSRDNRLFLTGTPNGDVNLWQIAPFKKLKTWSMPTRNALSPVSTSITALGFTSTDTYLAAGSDGFIHQLK